MKKLFAALAGGLIALAPIISAQASDSGAGKLANPLGAYNGAVLIDHDGPRTTPPACQHASHGNRWAVDASTLQGQAMLAVMMMAYSLGKTVVIGGTGTCSIWGDTETILILRVID